MKEIPTEAISGYLLRADSARSKKVIRKTYCTCALVVHEDLIRQNPGVVKDLVRGIAASGAWAETHHPIK